MEDKRKRMGELTAVLNAAARAYYAEDSEIMSNLEYDRLYDELAALENETGIVLSGSPTSKVGYEVVSELPKEEHAAPMLSLDKTKDQSALREWLGDKEGLLSWKLDGLTIALTYRGGGLVKAVTRGNGQVGEVVTGSARAFANIPLKIPYEGEILLRGEAVISYPDFEKINEEIEDVAQKYKNPRNLSSGSVRQLNSKVTAERRVKFYAFTLVTVDARQGAGTVPAAEAITAAGTIATVAASTRTSAVYVAPTASRDEQLKFISSLGFQTVEYFKVTAEDVEERVKWFADHIETNELPSDGLVLTFDDIAYSESLGSTSKFPKDSIAFKWEDEQRETTLREIEWSASRTGLINPVAIFEPVELEGTTVSRASVHNISILEELKLGVGDRIKVYKANMIIPQIAENLTMSGAAAAPSECPVCGGATSIKDENGVKSLYCTNEKCLARRVKSFTHFVSRDALNIEGLSEATLEKFIAAGFIHEPADLFKLERFRGEIVEMDGFGERSYENLTAAVGKARETSQVRLLYSLGIPGVGLSNAKLICGAYEYDWEKIRTAKKDDLVMINGIGDVMADSIVNYFTNDENLLIVKNIIDEINFEEVAVTRDDTFKGLTFVITGSLETYANRGELKSAIEAKGGKVAGSVSAKTNYLINNDKLSGSAKNKAAKELGVGIIDEAQIRAWLDGGFDGGM
ncbi:MAG: NAD-dependent DNA ligase LigA [Clostridiales Family XIII bacterium]|nr:NAD-dependent DNA ligase LigA [Clostridiales Family XIII bacterium]